MRQTVEQDLPAEADHLRRYDEFRATIADLVEMHDRTIDLLFRMLKQNGGRLSRRAREKEFASLAAGEIERIEAAYGEAFPAAGAERNYDL